MYEDQSIKHNLTHNLQKSLMLEAKIKPLKDHYQSFA